MLKRLFFFVLLAAAALAPVPSCAQQVSQERIPQEKEQILWQKLEATISEVDHNLNGVLGVAILDLTTGRKYLLHADEVLPTASSIKIAILAELYHQAQQVNSILATSTRCNRPTSSAAAALRERSLPGSRGSHSATLPL